MDSNPPVKPPEPIKKKIDIKDSVFGEGFNYNNNNNREVTDEEKRIISRGNQKDLKLFSSMFASSNNDNEDVFEFDLFGMNNENNTKKGETDENCINIERSNNDIKSKMSKQFDNLNDDQKKDEDEDDLLDLMDKNI